MVRQPGARVTAALVVAIDGEARFRYFDRESSTRGMGAAVIFGLARNDRDVRLRFRAIVEFRATLHAHVPPGTERHLDGLAV